MEVGEVRGGEEVGGHFQKNKNCCCLFYEGLVNNI